MNLSELRKNQGSIVILTGAGISAESGIRTFRDGNGLWENHAVEDVATPEAFQRNPQLVQKFYNARRAQLLEPSIQPNAAHFALAQLEQQWPGDFLLVTQNVDDLHDRAGSQKLIHMHGELLQVRCVKTHQVFGWRREITDATPCPCCATPNQLRPNIVWFGEIPLAMDHIFAKLESCDLFIAIGTSGQVYPAASFVSAIPVQSQSVEVNLEISANRSQFDRLIQGPAGVEVPKLVKELLNI